VIREVAPSLEEIRSPSDWCHEELLPLLPDLKLVLLFFLIGTHSFPTAFIIGREHFG
jgi:hypothetical protein